MAEMKQFGIDLELDDTIAQGNYSNLAIISHSTSEFIIDFAAVLPGVQKARVKSRIILTPEHAKRLLRSLQENIVRYESNVGKIEIPTPSPASETGPKMGEAYKINEGADKQRPLFLSEGVSRSGRRAIRLSVRFG